MIIAVSINRYHSKTCLLIIISDFNTRLSIILLKISYCNNNIFSESVLFPTTATYDDDDDDEAKNR